MRSKFPGLELGRFLIGAIQLPSDQAMCRETLHRRDVFSVRDLLSHPIYHDNPLVVGTPFLRAYAGCGIRSAQQVTFGTFCLFDTRRRQLSSGQISMVRGFAQLASDYLNACIHTQGPAREEAVRHLVECADIAFSIGDRDEAEHLVHLAYRLLDDGT
ncbi:MAG: hypothetical protein AB7O80_09180 [Acetobacteraceae bacterium]